MSTQDTNVVVLVGRLTKDSELRYTSSGTAICTFSMAVNRRVKKGDQWTDEASFFDMTLFGKTAENLSKYLVKGGQVAVQGSLKQDRWSKDGQNFSKVGVFVESVQLIGGKSSGQEHQQQQAPQSAARPAEDFDPGAYEDSIPF